MRKSTRFCLVIGLYVVFGTAAAIAHDQNSNKSDAGHSAEIPYAVFQSALVGSRNESKLLPTLDYWGVGNLVWGMSSQSGEAVEALQESQSRACEIAGHSCRSEPRLQRQTVSGVRYTFLDGQSGRAERLKVFQSLKRELISTYGPPSITDRDEEMVRGQDAFVQGLDHHYALEWLGVGTDVSLVMTSERLYIDLKPTPGAENTARAESWQQFKRLRKSLPKAHPLQNIGKTGN